MYCIMCQCHRDCCQIAYALQVFEILYQLANLKISQYDTLKNSVCKIFGDERSCAIFRISVEKLLAKRPASTLSEP